MLRLCSLCMQAVEGEVDGAASKLWSAMRDMTDHPLNQLRLYITGACGASAPARGAQPAAAGMAAQSGPERSAGAWQRHGTGAQVLASRPYSCIAHSALPWNTCTKTTPAHSPTSPTPFRPSGGGRRGRGGAALHRGERPGDGGDGAGGDHAGGAGRRGGRRAAAVQVRIGLPGAFRGAAGGRNCSACARGSRTKLQSLLGGVGLGVSARGSWSLEACSWGDSKHMAALWVSGC